TVGTERRCEQLASLAAHTPLLHTGLAVPEPDATVVPDPEDPPPVGAEGDVCLGESATVEDLAARTVRRAPKPDASVFACAHYAAAVGADVDPEHRALVSGQALSRRPPVYGHHSHGAVVQRGCDVRSISAERHVVNVLTLDSQHLLWVTQGGISDCEGGVREP